MSSNKELKQALESAYDVCITMEHHTANVIASDGLKDSSSSDRKLNLKAKKYINWYKKTILPQPPKQK